MVAVDLDDVVLAAAVAHEAAPFARVRVHHRVAKHIADIGGVGARREVHDRRDQLDRVDVIRSVGHRSFRLLTAGAPDHQNTVVRAALQVVRGEHTDLPEILVDLVAMVLHQRAQRFVVAVELVEVAGLVATVILQRLAVAALVPGFPVCGAEGFVDDIDLRDRIPAHQLIPAGSDGGDDAALLDVISEVDVVVSAHGRHRCDDHGESGAYAAHSA